MRVGSIQIKIITQRKNEKPKLKRYKNVEKRVGGYFSLVPPFSLVFGLRFALKVWWLYIENQESDTTLKPLPQPRANAPTNGLALD